MHLEVLNVEPELRESLHAAARGLEWAEAMYNSCTLDTEEVYYYRYMAAKAQLDLLIRKARQETRKYA